MKGWPRCGLCSGLAFVAGLLPPTALSAAEASHAAEHAPSVSDLFFPVVNFAIFALILGRYLVPALREYLRGRAESAATAARESGAALRAAEEATMAVRRRNASMREECESIIRDLVAAATHRAERLLAQANESGRRRLADAGLLAEQERHRALAAVREEIAERATQLAESRIRGALTPGDQRRFVQQFLRDAPNR